MASSFRLLTPVLLACASAAAQTTTPAPSDGPLPGIPTLFSVDARTTLPEADRAGEGYVRAPGFAMAPAWPKPLAETGIPDFSAKALFRACMPATTKTIPEVDAMSIGLDWMPFVVDSVKKRATVKLPPNQWAGPIFSVSRGTLGKPGSRIAQERTRVGGASGDVFLYVFKDSKCLPPSWLGKVFKSTDAEEMPLPRTATSNSEVDSLDLFPALFRLRINTDLGLVKPPTLYFSVKHADRRLVPTSWWAGKPVSGSTILMTTWNPTTKSWTCPKGRFAPADLGLSSTCDDIDAFAYNEALGMALLSTRRTSSTVCAARDQLLVVDLSKEALALAVPLYNTAGELVSSNLEVEPGVTGEVDAICTYDPGNCQNLQPATSGNPRLGLAFGQPLGTLVGTPLPFLPAQVYRSYNGRSPLNPHEWRSQILGFGPRDLKIVYVALPIPRVPFQFVSLHQPAAIAFPGHPSEVVHRIPARLPPTSPFRLLDILWISLAPGIPPQLALSHPLRIALP